MRTDAKQTRDSFIINKNGKQVIGSIQQLLTRYDWVMVETLQYVAAYKKAMKKHFCVSKHTFSAYQPSQGTVQFYKMTPLYTTKKDAKNAGERGNFISCLREDPYWQFKNTVVALVDCGNINPTNE